MKIKGILQEFEARAQKTLDLSCHLLSDADFEHLLSCLKRTHTLESLILPATRLSASRMRQLVAALVPHQSLQKLVLDNNEIGATGFKFLAELAQQNTQLTHISARLTRLNDLGAQFLAEGFAGIDRDVHIDLGDCSALTSKGVQRLSQLRGNQRNIHLQAAQLPVITSSVQFSNDPVSATDSHPAPTAKETEFSLFNGFRRCQSQSSFKLPGTLPEAHSPVVDAPDTPQSSVRPASTPPTPFVY